MQAQIVFKSKVLWFENHQKIQVEERPCLFEEGFFPICIPRHEDLQALGRSFLWSVYVCVGGPQHSAPNWSVKLQKPFVTWLPISRSPGRTSGVNPTTREDIEVVQQQNHCTHTRICIAIFRLSRYYGLIAPSNLRGLELFS